jgi:hypothetical protein
MIFSGLRRGIAWLLDDSFSTLALAAIRRQINFDSLGVRLY